MESFQYKTGGGICSRCVMDNTAKGITYDESGECTFCKIHDELEEKYLLNEKTTQLLNDLIQKIKARGKNKKYDCIVGVSGGRDSSFTLYKVVKMGLRPLAVHFDNGWNSENAVRNIENLCNILKVDLHTHVADWEEFKNLQRAFLKASVPDAEVPTDWVIFSVLFQQASKYGIKYIIHGHSFRTEGTTPLTWTYMDGRYVKDIQQKFGTRKIHSFPVMTMTRYLYYIFVNRIKQVRLLYYIPYNESEILAMLTQEVGWKNYGGKHHESKYTGFFQSYILTRKFDIDKRKLHLSALLRSGQLTRNEALAKIKEDPYDGGREVFEYCLKKLDFAPQQFDEIMHEPPKSFLDYKSYYQLVKKLEGPVKWGTRIGIIPDTVYRKFFKFRL